MLGTDLEVRFSIIFAFCAAIITSTIIICQGNCSIFTVQPSNKTVKYGEIVQFECQVHMDYSQHLYLYFGNTILHPSVIGNFSTLDERQFSVDVNQCINCLQNQTVVGRVWILVNSKTLQIIDSEPFRCRVFYNRTFKDSHLAFIKVIYPECTFSPVQSDADALLVTSISMPLIMSTFVPPRKLPTNSTSVSVVQVLNSPCSSGELNTPGNVKTNELAISICAGLVLIMLTLLILTYVCICIQHRKRLSCVKSSKLPRSQFCSSMVQNPIYESDGPVYDIVQPQFNSQVTAAINTCTDLKHQDLEISTSQLTDKNHYVDQPSLIHSGSFSSHSSDYSCNNGQLVSQEGGYSACTTNGHILLNFEGSTMGVTLPKEEDLETHTNINPVTCSSLSGGWDEED